MSGFTIVSYTIEGEGDMMFDYQCPICGRFTKPDKEISTRIIDTWGNREAQKPNATCSKCGRVAMNFVGWL